MFCTQCGSANPDDAKFCIKCGTSLAGVVGMSAASSHQGAIPGQPYPGTPETSGKAIASLICGFLFFFFPAAIAAIVLGHLSHAQIRRSAGRLTGRGLATAGLVLGYLGILWLPIIAAIAIPNLLRARIAANEASAVGTLRTMNTAAVVYESTYNNGFPPSQTTFGGVAPGTCNAANLMDDMIAVNGGAQKSGYIIAYVASPSGSLSEDAKKLGCTIPGATAYEIHADPITRGTTGNRSFFTDQTGVIRVNPEDEATANSPPLK